MRRQEKGAAEDKQQHREQDQKEGKQPRLSENDANVLGVVFAQGDHVRAAVLVVVDVLDFELGLSTRGQNSQHFAVVPSAVALVRLPAVKEVGSSVKVSKVLRRLFR